MASKRKRAVLLEDGRRQRKRKKKKHSRLSSFMSTLLIFLGLAVGFYPIASNYVEYREYQRVMDAQQTYIYQQPEQAKTEFLKSAYAYNENLASGALSTSTSDTDAMQEYQNILNIAGDGVMATITIPKINTKLPIYHGTTDEVLMHGVGHLVGTSLPVGGPSTHSVLTGHTGLPSARLFDSIDKLEEGDWFVISVMGEDIAYQVKSVDVVLPDETDSLSIQQGKDLVTLVTCTPYGVNTHRLLVHAERIDVPSEWYDNDMANSITPSLQTFANTFDPYQVTIIIAGVAVVFFFLGRLTARIFDKPPREIGRVKKQQFLVGDVTKQQRKRAKTRSSRKQ